MNIKFIEEMPKALKAMLIFNLIQLAGSIFMGFLMSDSIWFILVIPAIAFIIMTMVSVKIVRG